MLLELMNQLCRPPLTLKISEGKIGVKLKCPERLAFASRPESPPRFFHANFEGPNARHGWAEWRQLQISLSWYLRFATFSMNGFEKNVQSRWIQTKKPHTTLLGSNISGLCGRKIFPATFKGGCSVGRLVHIHDIYIKSIQDTKHQRSSTTVMISQICQSRWTDVMP